MTTMQLGMEFRVVPVGFHNVQNSNFEIRRALDTLAIVLCEMVQSRTGSRSVELAVLTVGGHRG
jgi:hypothetical protein